jgi:hypothetical protein
MFFPSSVPVGWDGAKKLLQAKSKLCWRVGWAARNAQVIKKAGSPSQGPVEAEHVLSFSTVSGPLGLESHDPSLGSNSLTS